MQNNINIKLCEVLSNEDNLKSGRIKVRILPEDKGKTIEELPYAYPLMPKMFTVLPKVGEAVVILLTADSDSLSNRYYMGPIISQLQSLEYDGFSTGALSNYPDSLVNPKVSHDLVPDTKGSYGDDEDIVIYGRKHSDIILKENDVDIRCGARIEDETSKIGKSFNKLNPAYLKLRYNEEATSATNEKTEVEHEYNSTATLVADQINLIANNSKQYFNTTDNNNLITDEEMQKIIAKAHVLPYGDILVDFLKYFLKMFKEHAHPYPGMPTILPSGNDNFFNYDFSKMLSENIRIN